MCLISGIFSRNALLETPSPLMSNAADKKVSKPVPQSMSIATQLGLCLFFYDQFEFCFITPSLSLNSHDQTETYQ